MQCLILAGGLGTRVKEYTEDIPKALIPILNRPFLGYQLESLAQNGVDSVVLSIGYKGQMIRDYIESNGAFGMRVDFVDEGGRLRGTGGAIRFAIDQCVMADRFFVIYGDSYLPVDYEPIWRSALASRLPALMTIYRNEGAYDTSNVIYDQETKTILKYTKTPSEEDRKGLKYIDYGLCVLSRAIVQDRITADQVIDVARLYESLSLEGRLAGFEVHERFYEIGSHQGIRDLQDFLKSH